MKKGKVSNELKIVIYVVFIISAILFFSSLVGILFNDSLDTRRHYASVIVRDKAGFDLNDSALTFGAVLPGSSSTRNVVFKNNYDFDIVVNIKSEGNISELLSYEQRIVISSGGEKEIRISVGIPHDYEEGFYDGEVLYVIRKYH